MESIFKSVTGIARQPSVIATEVMMRHLYKDSFTFPQVLKARSIVGENVDQNETTYRKLTQVFGPIKCGDCYMRVFNLEYKEI